MGFGSYDESEQQDQDVDYDEDDSHSLHHNDHDGEVSIEGADSSDELLSRLQDMKDGDDD